MVCIQKKPTFFMHLSDGDLLKLCGADARMWARAFCEIVRERNLDATDVEFMTGWFANAIETACDVRRKKEVA